MKAQGATEYLVLLAVVLVVSLVSTTLLGFFPGMANDVQMLENSQIYWKSVASPIAITEVSNVYVPSSASGPLYQHMAFRIRNNGMYPLRLNGIYTNSSKVATTYMNAPIGVPNMSDTLLMPGDEMCFGESAYKPNVCPERMVRFIQSDVPSYDYMCLASNNWRPCVVTTPCPRGNSTEGYMTVKGLSFIYTVYVDGQEMTKTQTGEKDFIVKCGGAR